MSKIPDNQQRPPAYQEYGATLLNLESVKLMSLAERGLLATMRWCIWGNDTLPADPTHLARVLGLPEAEVRANLTEAVLSFFAPARALSERLECPELTAQMERLMERRRLKLDNVEKSNEKRRHNAERDAERDAERRAKRDARKQSKDKTNQGKSFPEGAELTTGHKEFVNDMEHAEKSTLAGNQE